MMREPLETNIFTRAKLCFIDVETTGVDPKVNGIWQLAGSIRVDGETKENFNWTMKPFSGQLVSAEALRVGGITMEQLREFPEPGPVHAEFQRILGKYVKKYDREDKYFAIGYNMSFDDSFLRAWHVNNQNKYYGSYIWYPPICVAQMAALYLGPKRAELENFKLKTVCEYFGIPLENAHDASGDISATIKLFDYLTAEQPSLLDHAC